MLHTAPPLAATVLLLGASRRQIDLGSCSAYPSVPIVSTVTTTDGSGVAVVRVRIPNDLAVLGGEMFAQFAVADAGGPLLGVAALSDGLHILIGR